MFLVSFPYPVCVSLSPACRVEASREDWSVANPNPFLCALCASVVNPFSLRKEFIENRHDLLREAGQAPVGVVEGLVRVDRGDQPHERPVGPFARGPGTCGGI